MSLLTWIEGTMETSGSQTVVNAPRANPFFHRGPIRDPAYFYGRPAETGLLLNLVRNAQSVSVLGQRRIGKSSFVLHAANPLVLQAHGLDPEQTCFVYVDCQGRGDLTESELCALLRQGLSAQMKGRAQRDELGGGDTRSDLRDLEDYLAKATEAGFRLVFILDEFEAIAASRKLTPDFFSSLRRIITGYPVAVVTVTKDPLTTLTDAHESVLSSPFFNIFQPLSLGLFSAEEAEAMLQGLAAKGGLRFAQATLDFISDLAGGLPLLLQLAGFYAFEQIEGQADTLSAADYYLVRERFWATAVQHFEYYWSHLDDEARYVLATLPLMSGSGNRALEMLARECLIVRRGPRYDYFSSAFQDFVRTQKVPGLVNAGPFVVDHQQRAIMLDGRPLDLTKTEYTLFMYLLQRSGEVITYAELEENVWGDAFSGDPERLKAAIKHLRQALGEYGDTIANVRGVGYQFQP
jgi:hypothetical protein